MHANPGISFSMDPDDVARAVEFIVTQPLTMGIHELVITPQADITRRMS
jgi:NADP-dependent 3-hydroxy acid dehydrogenase YdfG